MGSRGIVAFILAASVPTVATAAPIGHVRWRAEDDRWKTSSAVGDLNHDGSPDVVIASGHRVGGAQMCLVPPGNPASALAMARDRIMTAGTALEARAVASGELLWMIEVDPSSMPAEQPDRYTLSEALWVGDLDGQPGDEIFWLTANFPPDLSETTQVAEIRSGQDGSVLWRQETTRAGFWIRTFEDLGGDTAYIGEATITVTPRPGGGAFVDVDGGGGIYALTDGGPSALLDIPETLTLVEATDAQAGVAVAARLRVEVVSPTEAYAHGATALLDLDWSPDPSIQQRWIVEEASSLPAIVRGDPSLVVYGRGEDGSAQTGELVARSLEGGSLAWTRALDVGPAGGELLAMDIDDDGQDELIVSPAWNREIGPPLLRGTLWASLHALDRAGQDIWRIDELGMKFRVRGLSATDLDGDGLDEILGVGTHQDGFALCSAPADEGAMIVSYDAATGASECRFSTERMPVTMSDTRVPGEASSTLVVPTIGGATTAFVPSLPACL